MSWKKCVACLHWREFLCAAVCIHKWRWCSFETHCCVSPKRRGMLTCSSVNRTRIECMWTHAEGFQLWTLNHLSVKWSMKGHNVNSSVVIFSGLALTRWQEAVSGHSETCRIVFLWLKWHYSFNSVLSFEPGVWTSTNQLAERWPSHPTRMGWMQTVALVRSVFALRYVITPLLVGYSTCLHTHHAVKTILKKLLRK